MPFLPSALTLNIYLLFSGGGSNTKVFNWQLLEHNAKWNCPEMPWNSFSHIW